MRKTHAQYVKRRYTIYLRICIFLKVCLYLLLTYCIFWSLCFGLTTYYLAAFCMLILSLGSIYLISEVSKLINRCYFELSDSRFKGL